MFEVVKKEIPSVTNYHGRPIQFTEVRWYVIKDGEKVLYDSNGMYKSGGVFFLKKKDALEEVERLSKKKDSSLDIVKRKMEEDENFKVQVQNLIILNPDLFANQAKLDVLARMAKGI